MKKDILYAFSCLAFATIVGGAVYEHLNVVPKWSAGPPTTLSMFQGPYGLNPELFWKIIHPVNILLFLLTLVTHWKTERRKNIAVVFAVYAVILVVTALFFVPELINITTSAFSPTPDPVLTRRARLWENLSLLRLAVMVVLALVFFTGLAKPNRIAAA